MTLTADDLNVRRQRISALSQLALAQAEQARQMSSIAREHNRQVMKWAVRVPFAGNRTHGANT